MGGGGRRVGWLFVKGFLIPGKKGGEGGWYVHYNIAFTIPQGNGLDAFTVMHKITGGGGGGVVPRNRHFFYPHRLGQERFSKMG